MTNEDKQALHLSAKTKAIRAAAERAGAHREVAEFVPTRFELAIIANHYFMEECQWAYWSDFSTTCSDIDRAEAYYNRLRTDKISQTLGEDELLVAPDLMHELWEERFFQLREFDRCYVCREPAPGFHMEGWVLVCPKTKVDHRNHIACPSCSGKAWDEDHYMAEPDVTP